MRDDSMPLPWPIIIDDPAPVPEAPYLSKAERKAYRHVGPTGGKPTDIKKRKAQRDARRRNRP